MINNAAAHCAISVKFGTQSDHMTPDLQQTFKVKGHRSRSLCETSFDRQLLLPFRKSG